MKHLIRLRVMVNLFVAVLMPLELGHCALMTARTPQVAVEAEHHDQGDHDCCPEAAPAQDSAIPTDPCCCDHIQLPALTATVSVTIDAPLVPALHAVVRTMAMAVDAPGVFAPVVPDSRSGSPPEPATSQQSPRSPPYSA